MIKFKKILKKLSLGNMLEQSEIKYVKSYLGYSFGVNHIIGLIIFIICLATSLALSFTDFLIYGILVLILGIIIFLFYAPVIPQIFKKQYDLALEEYLRQNLKNDSFIQTGYLIQSGFPINKSKVYFIFDDYYFKIQEDLLITEEPKKNIIFKYPDLTCSFKNSIAFKLQDIISYTKAFHNLDFKKSSYTDLVKKDEIIEPSFRINLNNFKSINLGENIYPYFKKLIKEKEE